MAVVLVKFFVLFFSLFLCLWSPSHAATSHTFSAGDRVPFYVNKVGPYFNTHETYHYYKLPVCRPEKVSFRSLTLGEVLDGDRMAEALYQIKFKENVKSKELCEVKLSQSDIEDFRTAIEDLYYFEFIIDDLPVRGFIGQLEERVLPHSHTMYLWTHMDFVLEYNGNQIVSANVSEKTKEVELVDLPDPSSDTLLVQFTYSVSWRENTALSFKHRNMHGQNFFPKTLEIHWLSILNSGMLVALLLGFVAIILTRAVRKDFDRYSRIDDADIESELQEDQGWKVINTDVFRFPQYKTILAAILGNGVQFITLGFFIILLALSGIFNVHRHGAMNAAAVVCYALTCCVSGFVSSRLYRSLEGQNWAWNIVLTACWFAVPFFVVWSIINSVAWYNGSTQALPATTVILLIFVWLLVGFPLTVLGGIFGKKGKEGFDAPCRTKNVPREIPHIPFYKSTLVHMLVGGFLPFSAISVELYYIFATLWGREYYTLYGILLVVFAILIAVTACISVSLTYFQLSSEDYRWWWRSVFASGFTGVFVFLYAIFYFVYRSNMSGAVQTVQFFGYTLLACYVFFLMLGTIGFYSSLHFVRYIYTNLKLD